jgi:predicted flavoprotein YhiN
MDSSNNKVNEVINIDTSNNNINQSVNMDVIKECRNELINKFGINHPDLQKLSCFWFDVDKQKKQSVSIDELLKH